MKKEEHGGFKAEVDTLSDTIAQSISDIGAGSQEEAIQEELTAEAGFRGIEGGESQN